MSTDVTGEVRRLALLSFAKRGRALALAARSWTAEAADAVIDALNSGDIDDRRLGLFLAVTRSDVSRVEKAIADPALRHPALAAARTLPVSDDALAQVVLSGSRRDATGALHVIETTRRAALAERLLPDVLASYGPALAVRLWRIASVARVERDAEAHHLAWQVLVERAPDAALELALRTGRTLGQNDMSTLCSRCPDRALAMLTRPNAIPPYAVGHLLQRPVPFLALLRSKNWIVEMTPAALPKSTLDAIAQMPQEDIKDLHDRCSTVRLSSTAHPLFELLPIDERERAVKNDLGLTALSAWNRPEHIGLLQAHLRKLPPDSLRRALTDALGAPIEDEARKKRLRALRPYLDLAQVRAEHQALGPANDKHDRGERFLALASALRHELDPKVVADVLAEIEPVWHDRWRTPTLAEVALLPKRVLALVAVQTFRDAALTATQSRDVGLDTLRSAETALRKAIHESLDRADFLRAASLTEILVQVRLDVRVRWHLMTDATTKEQKRTELLPAPLLGSPEQALALRAAYKPVRIEGTTPMLGPVAVARFDPESEQYVLGLLLGERPRPVVSQTKEASIDGPVEEVMRLVKSIALRETDLVDALFDRSDLTDPVVTDLLAEIPGRAERRWTPAQRMRFTEHLMRVAEDARLPPNRRTKAVRRIDDARVLAALLPGSAGPVTAAVLTQYVRFAEPTTELRDLVVERARRSGVVGRAALAALDMLVERKGPPTDLAPYRTLVLSDDCAVVSRRTAATRIANAATEEARDLLLAVFRTEGMHIDVLKAVLPGLARFVDQEEPRRALKQGIETIAGAAVVFNTTGVLLFPNETTPRPVVAKAFVSLAESLAESNDPAIATAAMRACVREHRLCSTGLDLARDKLASPRTHHTTADSIAAALIALPEEPVATWSAALDALATMAAAPNGTFAKLRLARFAAVTHRRPWSVPLAAALRAAGMNLAAVAMYKRVIDVDAGAGVPLDAAAWSAYLALVDAQAGRRIPWNIRLSDPASSKALVAFLTQQSGVAAAMTAVDLLLLIDEATRADPSWQTLVDRARAMHPDAAERLLMATGKSG